MGPRTVTAAILLVVLLQLGHSAYGDDCKNGTSPLITKLMKDEVTVAGRTVTLSCRAKGDPKPRFVWLKDGHNLVGSRYTVQSEGDLKIRDVQPSDSGKYTCSASNSMGVAQYEGSLIVRERTRILETEDYEVPVGLSVQLACRVVTDPSLTATVRWLKNGQPIDLEEEQRMTRAPYNSLLIVRAKMRDSGSYTCEASTELDEAHSTMSLVIQDVPNPPKVTGLTCGKDDATVRWRPTGDNRSPILRYKIEYSTSSSPGNWIGDSDSVPPSETRYKVSVPMKPWTNYTFRVIAINKVGASEPSSSSDACQSPLKVPDKNPDVVRAAGTAPDNLVITWDPIPEDQHGAPGFHYRVYFRRDIPGELWTVADIHDWTVSSLMVPSQPTYKKYRVKVIAINELGPSRAKPREVIGYSGEGKPVDPPRYVTLVNIIDGQTASIRWDPVDRDSVRGYFKGYKIQIWTDKNGEGNVRELLIKSDVNEATVHDLSPNCKNYLRVLAYNRKYDGPPSKTISFYTPEGPPGPVSSLDAYPLGSSALYLVWKQPKEPNGVLTRYTIYYEIVNGIYIGPRHIRNPPAAPNQTSAILGGLEPDTKYRVTIKASNNAGEGFGEFTEKSTMSDRPNAMLRPDKPGFTWRQLTSARDDTAEVKITWLPNLKGVCGSRFYVMYRRSDRTEYKKSEPKRFEDSVVLRGLVPRQVYIFKVVAVDGEYSTESDPQAVSFPQEYGKKNDAEEGNGVGQALSLENCAKLICQTDQKPEEFCNKKE